MLRLIKFALIFAVIYFFTTRVLAHVFADLPMVKDARHIVEVAGKRHTRQ